MSDGDAGSGGMPLSPTWMEPALLKLAELAAQQRLGHAYLVISEDLSQAALFNRLVALQQLWKYLSHRSIISDIIADASRSEASVKESSKLGIQMREHLARFESVFCKF